MDRTTLEEYLAQAEDHIDGAQQRIERQTRLVDQMRAEGRPTKLAEELLAHFKVSLQNYLADRDLIQRFIRSPDTY